MSKTTSFRSGYQFSILIFLLLFVFNPNIKPQATIGCGIEPSLASLLDLKQFASDNEITSQLGLALPRVGLIALDNLAPCVADADPDDMIVHTGLVVYNTVTNATPSGFICEGLYIWNGDAWARIQGEGCSTLDADEAVSYVMDGQQYNFILDSNADWTATTEDPYNILDVSTNPMRGSAGENFEFKFKTNVFTDSNKDAKIIFENDFGGRYVAQIHGIVPEIRLSPSSWYVYENGGEQIFIAISNSGLPQTYSIVSGGDWLTLDGNKLTASANTLTTSRQGTISITNGVVTTSVNVEQAARNPLLVSNIYPSYVMDGSEYSLTVKSDFPWTAAVEDLSSILDLTGNPMLGGVTTDYQFTFIVNMQTSGSGQATFTFDNDNGDQQIVQIDAVPLTITASPAAWDAPPEGGDESYFGISNSFLTASYTVTTGGDWLSFNENILTALPNSTGSERTGTITVAIGTATSVATITQQSN